MNFIPKDDRGYEYLMQHVHGITRAEWSTFIMATPVYFFAADYFHEKTLKDLWALWRPGSPVPIGRRFYRFGNMNMLISLGTTIAYFASLGELIVSAERNLPSSKDGDSRQSYFDSVVFLTFFLLLGRLAEATMKAKAGDAVSALGNLRPTTANLVVQDGEDDIPRTETVDVDFIDAGDVIRVPNGASPPCDGALLNASAEMDESSLTAKHGILVKGGGEAFQEASNLDVVVFDKTGTLTLGVEPKIVECEIFEDACGLDRATILGMLKCLEENSSHPLARAAVEFANSNQAVAIEVLDVEEIGGRGLKGIVRIAGHEDSPMEVLVGNEALLEDHSVPIPSTTSTTLHTWKSQGYSILLFACRPATEQWNLTAIFAASDPPRILGKRHNQITIAMVGDGINDAPALTAADVGIAVASGSDVAIQSASFILMQSDLRAVLTLVSLSKAVFRRVILNFCWAAVYNLIALPVAAGVLYPVRTADGDHVRLDPAWDALAMAGSSLGVVMSSLLLRSRVPWGVGYRAEN
ncbi:hypothetical protein CBER1_06696 [Cercospora berteroae]|uniref:P-type ATPase A domain-containing protein n=1 Tax=Cercospora berteroae TaxID=357750 RepID=A0A2S6CNA9_9PEZI|nr:hypothetical protein CBER1_06696 [Cercospora berteroae]